MQPRCKGRARQISRLILEPSQRREAVLEMIGSARRHLAISLFRCSDFRVLEEIAAAVRRGVEVEVMLTARARHWRKKLQVLAKLLESAGAKVHRNGPEQTKYHAKYIVADGERALISSINYTRKCYTETCDFLYLTREGEVVGVLLQLFRSDVEGAPMPEEGKRELVLGREGMAGLIQAARKSIRIIDHKLTDPRMLALLEARRQEGLSVEVVDKRALGGMQAHGKLMLIDDRAAVIGSMALSARSLDGRRELAVVIRDSGQVAELRRFYRRVRR
ncbi:MAG: hypothetical protein FJW20_10325 [Acidimicrobiia bacterium]|nr:hypothetical protein [Acidimicrobiia bacterium]